MPSRHGRGSSNGSRGNSRRNTKEGDETADFAPAPAGTPMWAEAPSSSSSTSTKVEAIGAAGDAAAHSAPGRMSVGELAKAHASLARQVATIATSQQRVESLLGAIASHVGVAATPADR